jgi:hypothetical protein
MRKNFICLMMVVAFLDVSAQYKKASFLNKSGRTYDMGVAGHFMSGGAGTVPGIYYSYGRDEGKRFFHWIDLELLLPTKFNFTTTDINDPSVAVTVSGKSRVGLVYRYNYGYYFTNIEKATSKLRPFVTLGANLLITGGTAKDEDIQYDPPFSNPKEFPPSIGFSFGANAGIGCIYQFSSKWGFKFNGGYNVEAILDSSSQEGALYKLRKLFGNHPYVAVGARFIINDE